jgi:hypothetical protein
MQIKVPAPPLKQTDKPFSGKDHGVEFEDAHFAYKVEEALHGVPFGATLRRSSGS